MTKRKPLNDTPDWTFDLLSEYQTEIERVAHHYRLDTYTNQIEVITADRAGLLAVIARAFVELGLQLNNAKITTLGERVEDMFWVANRDNNEVIDEKRIEQIIKLIKQSVNQQVLEAS